MAQPDSEDEQAGDNNTQGDQVRRRHPRQPAIHHLLTSLTNQSVDEPPAELDFLWGDGPANLQIDHRGTGRPWAVVQSLAALPLTAPLETGYSIARKVEPIERKTPGRWTLGDVARVSLTVDAQSDMTWVVVEDPVPSGASLLGSGLGRDSAALTQGE